MATAPRSLDGFRSGGAAGGAPIRLPLQARALPPGLSLSGRPHGHRALWGAVAVVSPRPVPENALAAGRPALVARFAAMHKRASPKRGRFGGVTGAVAAALEKTSRRWKALGWGENRPGPDAAGPPCEGDGGPRSGSPAKAPGADALPEGARVERAPGHGLLEAACAWDSCRFRQTGEVWSTTPGGARMYLDTFGLLRTCCASVAQRRPIPAFPACRSHGSTQNRRRPKTTPVNSFPCHHRGEYGALRRISG